MDDVQLDLVGKGLWLSGTLSGCFRCLYRVGSSCASEGFWGSQARACTRGGAAEMKVSNSRPQTESSWDRPDLVLVPTPLSELVSVPILSWV
jgi:hypothetical protein